MHDNETSFSRAVTPMSGELNHIAVITEQREPTQRWTLVLTRLFRRWLGAKWLLSLPPKDALVPSR
jgi:hypothetical protein